MERDMEYILSLIAAELCGEELTMREREEIDKWKRASVKNEEVYRYYQSLFARREALVQWDKIQAPRAIYPRIISTPRRGRRGKVMRFTAYVAGIAAVLIVAITFILTSPETPHLVAVHDAVASDTSRTGVGKQKARLLLESGEVVFLSDDSTRIRSHENIQVKEGGVLQYAAHGGKVLTKAEYHILEVNKGAEYQLELPDGSKVWLNSDSELKYPSVFTGGERKVYLKGEAYFKVEHAKEQPFIVVTGDYSIQVLGTEFNVCSYEEDEKIVTTLVNGKIAYHAGRDKGVLLPEQQCIYDKEAHRTTVKKVDVNQYVSWKSGLFIFNEIRVEDLAKQIARWYDVKIVFESEELCEAKFTGAMERYKPVNYIVQLLNETNTVFCELNGDVLIFRTK